MDARSLLPGQRANLDGGEGQDYLLGGSGDDQYFLHGGNDFANVIPVGRGIVGSPNYGGNDRYRLTPNSELTIVDPARREHSRLQHRRVRREVST